jgi:hypothetical protein
MVGRCGFLTCQRVGELVVNRRGTPYREKEKEDKTSPNPLPKTGKGKGMKGDHYSVPMTHASTIKLGAIVEGKLILRPPRKKTPKGVLRVGEGEQTSPGREI